jgi:Tol biopolymer transport system component
MLSRANILVAVLAALALAAPALAADSYAPGSTLLLSRDSGLGALPAQSDNDNWSYADATSGDGRFSVFASSADDLGVADEYRHVFVRDDQTGAVTLLDRAGPGGAVANNHANYVAISRDGTKACFVTSADNLVPGAGPNHLYVTTIATGSIVAADRATGGALGNGGAERCSLDADGGVVAFDSNASNLGGGSGQHVYARSAAAGTTQLVDSYNGTPGDSSAREPSINASGQIVAFATNATNLNGPGGDASNSDVYLRGLGSATPVLASRAAGGGGAIGNGQSGQPSVSDNGLVVAFSSSASNLGDGDGDATVDVHVRDVIAGTTTLVSRADGVAGTKADHESDAPALAGDGSAVAFVSSATTLGATPTPTDEGFNHLVYLRTLSGGQTTIVSRATGASGAVAAGNAPAVALDQHADHAVFSAASAGLDPLASGTFNEVFERHLSGGLETKLVSRPQDASSRPGQVGYADTERRAVSADGRFFVFSARAPLAGMPGGDAQVYVRDVLLGTTRLVSRANGADGAAANGPSIRAVISADGTKVAFTSTASNLTGEGDRTRYQAYVRNLVANTTTLASVGAGGPADIGVAEVALDQDGGRVAFGTYGANLVAGDTNNAYDIFVRDLVAGTTVEASLTNAGAQLDGDSTEAALSADGTRVGFASTASNAGDGAAPSKQHVYVRDLAAGTTTLVDRKADGSPADDWSRDLAMSADGNRFAFQSGAKLTAEAKDINSDVFVRDLAAGTTVMASGAADGTEANRWANTGDLSRDGTKVAFSTAATNLPAAGASDGVLYERDLTTGSLTVVNAHDGSDVPSNASAGSASLNADGTCVTFSSRDSSLSSPSYAGRDFDQLWMRVLARECPLQAPDTTITSGPDGSKKARTAVSTFAYKADESSATFACSLDGAPAKPCTDTFATPALRDGVHRFSVAATDRAGNTDPTPAFATFTVGVPPRLTKLRLRHGRLSFRLSEKATVRVRLARAGRAHSAAVAKLTIKRTLKAGTRKIKLPMRRLRKGHYHATVTATDAGGNRSVPKRKSFDVRAK